MSDTDLSKMAAETDPDKSKGLYSKYYVRRVDGSSEPGGKHEHCSHFVLDLKHDKFAAAALAAYADACEGEYPCLAEDVRDMVGYMLGRGEDS